jgi:hypothetical protein
LSIPRDVKLLSRTSPVNVTLSPATVGVLMVARKFPSASSVCHLRISAVVVSVPVAWITTASGVKRATAASTSWRFSASVRARATDAGSLWACPAAGVARIAPARRTV